MSVTGRLVMLLSILLLSACSESYKTSAERRNDQAILNDAAGGPITVGVIWKKDIDLFWQGIELAAAELNGEIDGRKLHIVTAQDGDDFDSTIDVIRRFAFNHEMIAVIGHRDSTIALPASLIYNESQMIYLVPSASSEHLFRLNFPYLFLMSPDDTRTTELLVALSHCYEYKKMVILYGTDHLSMERASLFFTQAIDAGLEIVHGHYFFFNKSYVQEIVLDLSNLEFDAIFLSANAALSGQLVKLIRDLGIEQPILGTDFMEVDEFLRSAGCLSASNVRHDQNCRVDNIYVPGGYDSEPDAQATVGFTEKFTARFGMKPDKWAALAYDAVMVLAAAIEKAHVSVPVVLTAALRKTDYSGLYISHGFDQEGDAVTNRYIFDRISQGRIIQQIEITVHDGTLRASCDTPPQSRRANMSEPISGRRAR